MLKIPVEIIRYEDQVFDTIYWAEENGHIDSEQREVLIDAIKEIKFEMYPEKNDPWE